MAKTAQNNKIPSYILWPFLILVFAVLLTPFWVFSQLLFPYITSKAFYFRILVEMAVPFYIFILVAFPHTRPSLKNKLSLALLAFLILSLVSSFFGVNVIRSIWGNFERMGGVYYQLHLTLLYFYLLMLAKLSEKYLQKFLQGLVLVSVVLSINGIFGKLGWATVTMDPSLPDRASSTFGNPIFFASFLILPLAVSIYFATRARGLASRAYYSIASIMLFFGIYQSGTRGAAVGLILAAFVAAVVYLLFSQNKKIKNITYGVLGAVVVFVAVGFVFSDQMPQGSTIRRIFKLNDSNSQARIIQWKMALSGFKDAPILGVGPENYYVLAQKYANPAINKYDQSWFDKPHNFYLEVLTTTGILGFAGYAAILFFAIFALYRAFREQVLSLSDFTILIGGFLAYLFQNAFVFDTVSPSVAFFIFLGLSGYFYEIFLKKENKTETMVNLQNAQVLLCVSVLGVVVLLYATNIQGMIASKDTNYGYAYAQTEPGFSQYQENMLLAKNFFNNALENKMNFDKSMAVNRYSEYAENLLKNAKKENAEFVLEQIARATAKQKEMAEFVKNDALLWIRLASDEMILDLASGRKIDTDADDAIEKALELSSGRVEPWQARLQLQSYRGDWQGALTTSRKLVELNPYNPKYRVFLAQVLRQNNQLKEAAETMESVIKDGYKFQATGEFDWLIDYYRNEKNYASAVVLYEKYLEFEPGNLKAYEDLVRIYLEMGNKEQAKKWLDILLVQDPKSRERLSPLIEAVK